MVGISQLGFTHSGLSAASDLTGPKGRGRKKDVRETKQKQLAEVVKYGGCVAEIEG